MAGTNGNGKQESTKRLTWEANRILIQDAYLQFVQQNNTFPTQFQIAKICKLSRQTIYNHLKEMKLEDITPAHKAIAESVLMGLGLRARMGDAPAAKLWFQLVWGWREGVDLNHKGSIELNAKSELLNRYDQIIATRTLEGNPSSN